METEREIIEREREERKNYRVDQTEKQEKGETTEEGGMSTGKERNTEKT